MFALASYIKLISTIFTASMKYSRGMLDARVSKVAKVPVEVLAAEKVINDFSDSIKAYVGAQDEAINQVKAMYDLMIKDKNVREAEVKEAERLANDVTEAFGVDFKAGPKTQTHNTGVDEGLGSFVLEL